MSETIVLITGPISNLAPGLGKALLETYLARPNHTVIGTVRDLSAPATKSLDSIPKASGTKLLTFQLEVTNPEHYPALISAITSAGIHHLDIVIANSGVSTTADPLASVSIEKINYMFDVNANGVLRLYQAVRGLLDSSPTGKPKWVTLGSSAGSLSAIEQWGTHLFAPYAISKAAVHWITSAIHVSEKSWTVFSAHPGLVQTEMGNSGARSVGLEEAPTTIEESNTKTIAVIDAATRETASGKLLDTLEGGKEMPW
ncbi:hypothetical protein BJX70DRAFT_405458 [Aspergillus crustosus]